MNETGKKRFDLWLFITEVAVLFRCMTFLVDIVTSTLGIMLARIPYGIVRPVIAALRVLGPVAAVVLAVLIARAIETRLIQMEQRRKTLVLSVMIVLAILPWQLQIKTTAAPVVWDEVPGHVKKEMGLQRTPGTTPEPAPTRVSKRLK